MEKELFIIKKGEVPYISKIENNQIHKICPLNYNTKNNVKIFENRWIISSTKKGRKIFIDEYDQKNSRIVNSRIILLPPKSYIYSSNVFKNLLYVGGSNINKQIGYYNLEEKELKSENISIPEKFKVPGKAIDEILIQDNLLYAVDNLISPKWIFIYNINNPLEPKFIKQIQLNSNGTYEHISYGDISKNYISLYSTTTGRSGQLEHISILNRNNGKTIFSISNKLKSFFSLDEHIEENIYKNFHWNKMRFYNDILLIPAGKCILALQDLKKLSNLFLREQHFSKMKLNNPWNIRDLKSTKSSRCFYPEIYDDESISSINPLFSEDYILIEITNHLKKVRYKLISIKFI